MPDLLAVFELGLEADHVEQRAEPIVLPQLHDRVRLLRRLVRIGQPDRLHRPVAQRLATALRHHLDRQAAVEIGGRGLPFVECDLVGRAQRIDERLVAGAVERAVDVIGARAAGGPPCRSAIAARRPTCRSCRDERSARSRRRRRAPISPVAARIASASAGEVRGPVATMTLSQSGGGRPVISSRRIWISGCAGNRCGDGGREAVAVDRERAAGRHLVARRRSA